MANLTVLQQIKNYVNGLGTFSNPNAGAAIAAVSGAESGGDPNAVNSTSGATGLFQDLGARKTQLLNAVPNLNVPGQVDNAVGEITQNSTYAPSLAALNNPNLSLADTESVLIHNFEAPGPAGEVQDMGRASALNTSLTGTDGENLQAVNSSGSSVDSNGDATNLNPPIDPSLHPLTITPNAPTGGSSAGGTSSTSGAGGGTAATAPTTVPAAINAQTAGQTADATKTAGATTSAATTAATSNTGLLASAETWGVNIFQRFGIVILGIVFVGVGLYFLSPGLGVKNPA